MSSPRIRHAVAAAALAVSAWGQSQTPAPSTPAPSTPAPSTPSPSTPSPSTPTIPTPGSRTPSPTPSPIPLPGQGQPQPSNQPPYSTPRPIRVPLSGKVVMEDGGPPPEPVRIECRGGGVIALTDSKGGFIEGSGTSSYVDARGRGTRSGSVSMRNFSSRGPLCTLRAVLPGYRSTEVNLMLLRDTLEPVTLILHPAEKAQGVTVSVTSLEAPKAAQKAFEQATKAMQKGKWAEAERNLDKAVQAHPRYAAAWSELGNVYAERKEPEKARKAFEQAVAIEPKFVSPYFGMAELAMHERNWQEMAARTATLIKLDPYGEPGAYAYNALAHLNLDNLVAAEKSAREGIKVDPMGLVPKNRHLLGVILMRKGDYAGALEQLKKYLPTVPQGPEADFVARQIKACEQGQAARAR